MKKNTISVDIIAFGEPDEATEKKLKEFHNTVNSSEGCFFGVIPPGPNLLSDTLLSTDLLAQDGVGQSGGAGGSGGDGGGASGENAYEFGVNPEVDPELALALRMSYEDEKARQEKARKEQEDADKRAGNKLEDIAEADEKQPLLSDEKKDDKKKKDDEDKMDTA
jgi:26S proteasome regulatory subunit N10